MVAKIWAVLNRSDSSCSSGLRFLADLQDCIDFADKLHANG